MGISGRPTSAACIMSIAVVVKLYPASAPETGTDCSVTACGSGPGGGTVGGGGGAPYDSACHPSLEDAVFPAADDLVTYVCVFGHQAASQRGRGRWHLEYLYAGTRGFVRGRKDRKRTGRGRLKMAAGVQHDLRMCHGLP